MKIKIIVVLEWHHSATTRFWLWKRFIILEILSKWFLIKVFKRIITRRLSEISFSCVCIMYMSSAKPVPSLSENTPLFFGFYCVAHNMCFSRQISLGLLYFQCLLFEPICVCVCVCLCVDGCHDSLCVLQPTCSSWAWLLSYITVASETSQQTIPDHELSSEDCCW